MRLTLPQLVRLTLLPAIALDSGGVLAIGIGAAADFFCAAKAAEGASPRTVEWYRMILVRAVRRFGDPRPVDAITAAELRAWLLELRSSLAPESIAGYVRGLKAFGNWCVAEELAAAPGFRASGDQPKRALGQRAAELLISRMSMDVDAPGRSETLPCALVQRAST